MFQNGCSGFMFILNLCTQFTGEEVISDVRTVWKASLDMESDTTNIFHEWFQYFFLVYFE